MAIKYQEIKDMLETAPFTKEELAIIAKVENYIDEKIKEKFDCHSITMDTDILEFKFNPDAPTERAWNVWVDIKSTRKSLMCEELKSRFEIAGWKWNLQKGEDDGPNRPGIDYWILSGKR